MTANNSNNGGGDVKEKIRAFVLEYAAGRVTELKDDEPILTSNIIDSLGSFRMISFLEETFPLTIEDTDMLPENFQTLNDCEAFVFGKLEMANGDAEHPTTPDGTGDGNVTRRWLRARACTVAVEDIDQRLSAAGGTAERSEIVIVR